MYRDLEKRVNALESKATVHNQKIVEHPQDELAKLRHEATPEQLQALLCSLDGSKLSPEIEASAKSAGFSPEAYNNLLEDTVRFQLQAILLTKQLGGET